MGKIKGCSTTVSKAVRATPSVCLPWYKHTNAFVDELTIEIAPYSRLCLSLSNQTKLCTLSCVWASIASWSWWWMSLTLNKRGLGVTFRPALCHNYKASNSNQERFWEICSVWYSIVSWWWLPLESSEVEWLTSVISWVIVFMIFSVEFNHWKR